MNELKAYNVVVTDECADYICGQKQLEFEAYAAEDVDAAIAKLKAENERLKRCEIWMKQHFYCEEVIACESAKNRRLKRALWLARANKAESEARGWYHSNAYIIKCDGLHNIKGVLYGKGFKRYPDEWIKLWIKIERLCLAKADEYK